MLNISYSNKSMLPVSVCMDKGKNYGILKISKICETNENSEQVKLEAERDKCAGKAKTLGGAIALLSLLRRDCG